MGERLYGLLTGMGLKVFFSRETLQDKLGVNYEPYIFAALKSAPAMVVLGTRADYFHAVWVRNEWSRFFKLKEADDQKLLMFACKDINDLPAAFRRMQAQLLTGDEALINIAENIRDHLTAIRGENTELVRVKCPECSKSVSVDPSEKASICPHCRKPFIVLDAIAKCVPGGNRIKCPHCGKEQERNKYGCIFCHKPIA